MNKRITSLFIITLIIGSCAPVSASSTPPVIGTATETIVASETPPSFLLQTDGPFLLSEQYSSLTIIDVDGGGRKEIQLPEAGYTTELEKAVSPDGRLLVYFAGSAKEPYDLTLNLLNLYDETSQTIAHLIAPGFPGNLRPIAETLDPSIYSPDCNSIECLTTVSVFDFEFGIFSFAWSPDGQSLVFAAQIDGPSSDIYIYDTQSQAIRRLTNEIGNIGRLEWSPNSEEILYYALLPGPVQSNFYWYAVDPRINSHQEAINDLTYPYSAKLGWITENSFLYAPFYINSGQSPTFTKYGSVRYINLKNNEIKEIWPYEVESIALDPDNGKIILTTKGTNYSQLNAGTYLVSLDGSFSKLSDTTYTFFEDQESFKTFLGLNADGQIYSISLDGDIRFLGPSTENTAPSISPNKKWILIFDNSNKITLYSDDLQTVNSWEFDEGIYSNGIQWSPDSLGITISTFNQKYYLSIPNGMPKPIDITGNSVWLP